MGAVNFYDCATLSEQYAQYSDNYIPNTGIPLDVLALYKQEVMDIQNDGAYMGIWQVFQTANVHSVLHNSNLLISNYCLFRRPPSAPKITPLTQC